MDIHGGFYRMTDDLLTTREVASRLKLHEATIYRLIKRQELPAVKIGGCYRIPLEALERRLAVPEKPST